MVYLFSRPVKWPGRAHEGFAACAAPGLASADGLDSRRQVTGRPVFGRPRAQLPRGKASFASYLPDVRPEGLANLSPAASAVLQGAFVSMAVSAVQVCICLVV